VLEGTESVKIQIRRSVVVTELVILLIVVRTFVHGELRRDACSWANQATTGGLDDSFDLGGR
jgi:hypothetical protein